MADVATANALGHEHLNVLADQLIARVAEHRLGSGIDELDFPGFIDADDGVGREFQELPLERLARVVRHGASIEQGLAGSRESACETDLAQSLPA
jgi:hypothetical protein